MMNTPVPINPWSCVDKLVTACPFVADRTEIDFENGPTCVFGDGSRLVRSGLLATEEQQCIFDFFNDLAEHGDEADREVLATGALESMNDDAASQRLARLFLRGNALELLETMRTTWGQPDFGTEIRR